MIELAPATAFMLYLALALITLTVVWTGFSIRSNKRHTLAPDSLLLVCEYCHCTYLEDATKTVTQCPQCNGFNKNNRYKSK